MGVLGFTPKSMLGRDWTRDLARELAHADDRPPGINVDRHAGRYAAKLAATREGLARSGSKAKGVQQVRDMLAEHAGGIYRAAEAAQEVRRQIADVTEETR